MPEATPELCGFASLREHRRQSSLTMVFPQRRKAAKKSKTENYPLAKGRFVKCEPATVPVSFCVMIIRSRRVVTPSGVRPASVRFENGKIIHVGEWAGAGDALDVG